MFSPFLVSLDDLDKAIGVNVCLKQTCPWTQVVMLLGNSLGSSLFPVSNGYDMNKHSDNK